MDFKNEIITFEEYDDGDDYVLKSGNVPVLFTAVHTMMQSFDDGSTKLAEPFTKACSKIAAHMEWKYSAVNPKTSPSIKAYTP